MSTTTPDRETILDRLKTLFQGITTSAGYRTTVRTVTRIYKYFEDIDKAQMPCITISDGIETRTYPGKRVVHNFTVMLKIYLYDTTQVSTKLNSLLKDIEEIIATDITLNNACGEMKIISIDTDEGFLDPYAIAEISLSVIYYTLESLR